MDNKLLTIIIPAFNVERYIEKCIDSFTENGRIDGRIEIIVVDDGSTDATGEIAEKYAKTYPDEIKVIRKENGGHGSAINAGMESAAGKYVKVVDADDWVITENISKILDALGDADADVCITGYESVNEKTGVERIYSTACDDANKIIGMERFAKIFDKMPAAFQFHGLCYRTDFYKSLGLYLSEGVFYEDQEYAILPFIKAETIMILQYTFYVYRLGATSQSVDYVTLQRRLGDMKSVIKRLVDEYNKAAKRDGWNENRDLFFKKRLSIAISSYYSITFVKTKNKKAGRKEAAGFRQFLEANNKELAAYVEPKYKTLSKLSRFPGVAFVYNKLMDSRFYLAIKRRWNG